MLSHVFVAVLAVNSALCLGQTEKLGEKSQQDMQQLAEFAVGEIYGKTDGQLPPVRVKEVRQQIVAGINYFLTLEVTFPDKSVHLCEATVYTQPWERSRELLKSDCPSMIGEVQTNNDVPLLSVSPTDPVVQRVAKYAVGKLADRSNCFKDPRLENVYKALDSDGIYTVDMTVCEWPFHKSSREKRMPHPCDLQQNLHNCHVVVYTKNEVPEKLMYFLCSGC